MGIPHYLAMTAAELSRNLTDGPIAWMGCHFSPYRRDLSNVPSQLPAGSLLMLDDITPMKGHDCGIIAHQLTEAVEQLGCTGVLLDFQRPGYEEAAVLVRQLTEQLPCPVGVSELYAAESEGPVFLPPVPLDLTPEAHFRPWLGREIWLELFPEGTCLTLTHQGCQRSPHLDPLSGEGFEDAGLFCHYRIETSRETALFTLWRTTEDLEKLVQAGKAFGLTLTAGLYQQWQQLHKAV